MKSADPYLNFAGNTEEAFTFYRSVFGGEFVDLIRFGDFGNNEMGVPEHELDKIAHIALPLGGNRLLMATDTLQGWPPLQMGNNFYIALETDTADEADRLFGGLSQDGRTDMPLQPTSWAEKYGTCVDRFGVQWMVMYTGSASMAGVDAAS
jgi:PhnB protein